ncbi:MAG: RrF2 family transcriptional regulator [Myxococcota bacterium]
MHLLAQQEYGLRCLVQVARHPGDTPATIPEIAEAEGLSPDYTAKLMRALRQRGLVTSTRGPGGGYRLARPASELSAWEVVEQLGGSLFRDDFCESHPGVLQDCAHSVDCSIRALWRRVEHAVRKVLEDVTIEDLTRSEKSLGVFVDAPSFAEERL